MIYYLMQRKDNHTRYRLSIQSLYLAIQTAINKIIVLIKISKQISNTIKKKLPVETFLIIHLKLEYSQIKHTYL